MEIGNLVFTKVWTVWFQPLSQTLVNTKFPISIMLRCICFVVASVAVAFEEHVLEDGISLLQLRAQKHDSRAMHEDVTLQPSPFVQIGSKKRCRGKETIRKTFGTAEACIAEFNARGDITTIAYWTQNNPQARHRGICMGWGGECSEMDTRLDTVLYLADDTEDDAAAVGDPHITTNTGQKFDLSLLKTSQSPLVQIGSKKRCNGKETIRKTFGTADACLAEFNARGDIAFIAYWTQNNPKARHRGICMGWAGECRQKDTQLDTVLYGADETEDDAAAVGDPHMSTNTGQKFDLS